MRNHAICSIDINSFERTPLEEKKAMIKRRPKIVFYQ